MHTDIETEDERRPRYWVVLVVTAVSLGLTVGSWVLGYKSFLDGRAADLAVLEPSPLSNVPAWILAYVSAISFGLLLVLAGRRRIFWIPTLLSGSNFLAYLFLIPTLVAEHADAATLWQVPLFGLASDALKGVAVLSPAVALLLVRPRSDRPVRPTRPGYAYLALLSVLAALLYELTWALLAVDSPITADEFRTILGHLLLGSLTTGLTLVLPLVIFGAGMATMNRWLPAIPLVLGLLAYVAAPRVWDGQKALASAVSRGLQLAIVYAAWSWPEVERWWEDRRGRLHAGDTIVLREVWEGEIFAVRPTIVVEDTYAQKVFYIPIGTPWMYPADDAGEEMHLPLGEWQMREGTMTTRHVLSFAWPRKDYAILLAWDADWTFTGYYVNLQTPLQRTEVGFHYTDHVLDIEVAPDRESWSWKDEDDLQRMIDEGAFTPKQADRLRAWGESALVQLRYETPFDEDWSTWRPNPAWTLPLELPEHRDEGQP